MNRQRATARSSAARRIWTGLTALATAILLWLGWEYRDSLPIHRLEAAAGAPAEAATAPAAPSRVAALGRLERSRARLVDAVVAVDGLDASEVRQAHHVFGELDLYQWVFFAGFHERRHTAQLREISAALRAR